MSELLEDGKLSRFLWETAEGDLMMWCPACEMPHSVNIKRSERPKWDWNGNAERPTISPSIRVKWSHGDNHELRICHSFIRDGEWQYCGDCTHSLAGQTVAMVGFPQ